MAGEQEEATPREGIIFPWIVGQVHLVRAIHIHYINLFIPVAATPEYNLRSIGILDRYSRVDPPKPHVYNSSCFQRIQDLFTVAND
jgi:hypothetical protein